MKLGVLYLMLIVYYMRNLSREELYIIFHKNPITRFKRYVYCSKAKENVTNDIFIQYKRSVPFTKNLEFLSYLDKIFFKESMGLILIFAFIIF